jgi:hypothetical protein
MKLNEGQWILLKMLEDFSLIGKVKRTDGETNHFFLSEVIWSDYTNWRKDYPDTVPFDMRKSYGEVDADDIYIVKLKKKPTKRELEKLALLVSI